jgi:hypothetical protein
MACARPLLGKAAAGSIQRRKQSVFCNALGSSPTPTHLTLGGWLLTASIM